MSHSTLKDFIRSLSWMDDDEEEQMQPATTHALEQQTTPPPHTSSGVPAAAAAATDSSAAAAPSPSPPSSPDACDLISMDADDERTIASDTEAGTAAAADSRCSRPMSPLAAAASSASVSTPLQLQPMRSDSEEDCEIAEWNMSAPLVDHCSAASAHGRQRTRSRMRISGRSHTRSRSRSRRRVFPDRLRDSQLLGDSDPPSSDDECSGGSSALLRELRQRNLITHLLRKGRERSLRGLVKRTRLRRDTVQDILNALVWDETIAAFDDGGVKYAMMDSRSNGERHTNTTGRTDARLDALHAAALDAASCLSESSVSSPAPLQLTFHSGTVSAKTVDRSSATVDEVQSKAAAAADVAESTAAAPSARSSSSSLIRVDSVTRRQRLMQAAYGNGNALRDATDHGAHA